ncbi:hypothetical protein [Reichenbachiella sp.]|uniref:hypothetical protein n=1 Tax=Reichenbachiella sp. TaxID=2184521 RepID=UPI003B5C2A80
MAEKLLIHNYDQFLDALNLCGIGVYEYDEVITSTALAYEDVLDSWQESAGENDTKLVLEHDHCLVYVHQILPHQNLTVDFDASHTTWIRVVNGSLSSKSIATGDTQKLTQDSVLSIAESIELSNTFEQEVLLIQLSVK